MGAKHIALAVVVVASLFALAEQAIALELGELQAVPSRHPPYTFRLAIISSPGGSSDIAAVTVRQPHDTLSFVKNDCLELRLHSLTDVELEVNQGGQTVNRLLLKSELQAARARLETATGSNRHQPAQAKGGESPMAEARPLTPAPEGAPGRALLEREIQGIRQEMHNLVGRVTPWEGLSTPAGHTQERAAPPVFTLMLGGLCIAGVTSLITGYVMQRSAVARERQRRRSLAASMRRVRGDLRSGAPTLPAWPRAQLSGNQPDALPPVTVTRRVRVSHKTRRRIRVRASSATQDATQERAAEHTRVVARISHAKPSAPAEVVEALRNLRRELIRQQRLRPPSANPGKF
jgi:hypothetical protein